MMSRRIWKPVANLADGGYAAPVGKTGSLAESSVSGAETWAFPRFRSRRERLKIALVPKNVEGWRRAILARFWR